MLNHQHWFASPQDGDELHESGKSAGPQMLWMVIGTGGPHTMRIIERYPIRLVNAVLKAPRQEVKKRYQLGALEAGKHVDEPDVWLTNPEYHEEIYDAITCVRLDPALVAKARTLR